LNKIQKIPIYIYNQFDKLVYIINNGKVKKGENLEDKNGNNEKIIRIQYFFFNISTVTKITSKYIISK